MAKQRTINEIRQTKEYYTGNSNSQDKEAAKQMAEIDRQECPLDPVEEAKTLIVHKITKHFNDVMFEMVNEEMCKNKVFQSHNYLTEAGFELFQDEYFEFFHTHHGDILYEVMQNITN